MIQTKAVTKALFLILLLCGSEAVRIDRASAAARAATEQQNAAAGPEEDWTVENQKCKWGHRKWGWGCKPVDSGVLPEGSCAYRFLPRDWKLSQSCRLTDKYMLSHDRAKYFKINAGVLAAKAQKFKAECGAVSLFDLNTKLLCRRRSTHLMRTIEFMAKAQGEELIASLSEEEKAEQKLLYSEALKHMSEAIGEDGQYVLMLRNKMQNDQAGVRADPRGSVKKIIELLEKLLRGSDEEKKEARAEIDAMPSATSAATGNLKRQQDAELEKLAKGLEREATDMADLIDKTSVSELTEDEQQEMQQVSDRTPEGKDDDEISESDSDLPGTSSLLQRALVSWRNDRDETLFVFAVIVMLVVFGGPLTIHYILVVLAAWALITIMTDNSRFSLLQVNGHGAIRAASTGEEQCNSTVADES